MALPRVRTARQAAEELKRLDPETKLCERHIRFLMQSGQVPTIHAGKRLFINLDILLDYLESDQLQTLSEPAPTTYGIRRIAE